MEQIERLEIEIESSIKGVDGPLNRLANALGSLKRATDNASSVGRVTGYLSKLGKSINEMQDPGGKLHGLATALAPLENMGKSNLGSYATSIKNIGTASKGLETVTFSEFSAQVKELVASLRPLSGLGKSNIGSYLNPLNKLQDTFDKLKTVNMGEFAAKIREVATALRPLGTEMEKVSNGFNAFPARIQRLITQNNRLTDSNRTLNRSYGVLGTGISAFKVRAIALYAILRRLGSGLAGIVNNSADYVEDLNLFSASMGKYADAAADYAEKVNAALGLDVGQWMRNQGMFMQIASGFGIIGDSANTMSKGLTQLGYDISSYFNISVESAMEKLQSGITGQAAPLRALGYAVDQATLQEYAYSLGIQKSISSMTQAEKAQIRYVAIMEQSKNVMGDLARTIDTPSNAIRVFQQSVTQLSRALGNILIPALNAVLPYVIAFVNVLTMAAQLIAGLFGFTLPTIDYTGIGDASSAVGDLEESLGGAGSKAKELKRSMLGFDEVNVLQDLNAATGGGGGGGGGGGDLGLDLSAWDYDFLTGVNEKVKGITDDLLAFWDEYRSAIETVGTALIIAFTAAKLISGINNLMTLLSNLRTNGLDGVTRGIIGAAGLIVAFTGAKNGARELMNYLDGEGSLGAALVSLVVGGAGAVIGGLAIGGPVGAAIAGFTFLAGAVVGVIQALGDRELRRISDMFGDIVLTAEQVKLLADQITGVDWVVNVRLALSEFEKLNTLRSSMEGKINEINGMNYKISIGLDLTDEEFAKYKLSIDGYVQDARDYVLQRGYAVEIGLSAVFDTDSEAYKVISGSNSNVTNFLDTQLAALGAELAGYLNEAYSDNLFTIDEMQKANEILADIHEIMNIITSSEIKAEFDRLKLRYSGAALTRETYVDLLKELEVYAEEARVDLESVVTEKLAALHANIDSVELALKKDPDNAEIRRLYDEAVLAYQLYFDSNPVEILMEEVYLRGSTFAFQTSLDVYGDEIEKHAGEWAAGIQKNVGDSLYNAMKEMPMYLGEDLFDIFGAASQNLLLGMNLPELSKEMQTELALAVEKSAVALQADIEQMEALRRAGLAVPKELSNRINDGKAMAELSGSVGNMYFSLGKMLTGDRAFLEALVLTENAAGRIPMATADGILNNMDVVVDPTARSIRLISDTVDMTVSEITPDIIFNMEMLGYTIPQTLKDSVEYNSWLVSEGIKYIEPIAVAQLESLGYVMGTTGTQEMLDTINDMSRQLMLGQIQLPAEVSNWRSFIEQELHKLGWQLGDPATQVIVDILMGMQHTWQATNPNFDKTVHATTDVYVTTRYIDAGTLKPSFTTNEVLKKNITNANKVATYASGSMNIGSGDLFIANEAGAELVGRIGSRTAVANQEQIGDAIFRYMSESGGGSNGLSKDDMADALEVAVARLLGSMSLVVDGEELGHVSIRNINRVQRLAGETLIEL